MVIKDHHRYQKPFVVRQLLKNVYLLYTYIYTHMIEYCEKSTVFEMFANASHTSRVLLTFVFDSRGRLEDERGVEGSALDACESWSIWLLVVKRCSQAWPLGLSTDWWKFSGRTGLLGFEIGSGAVSISEQGLQLICLEGSNDA